MRLIPEISYPILVWNEWKKNIYQVVLTQVKTIPAPLSGSVTHSVWHKPEEHDALMPGEAVTWEGWAPVIHSPTFLAFFLSVIALVNSNLNSIHPNIFRNFPPYET